MFGKLDSVRALKTLIKLSAVALTNPATVAVAGSLYPDSPITRAAVSVAALILVEGCLLLGWEMLDQQGKNATMMQRWLYAGLAWVAYFALFGIAVYHQEGIAGFAFRLTLGVMLVYASAEAGLLASIKTEGQADRDIFKDWRVRRYARKLARRSAMDDLDLAVRMRQLDRQAHQKVYTLQTEHDTQRQLAEIESGQGSDSPGVVEMTKLDRATLRRANATRKLSKREAMGKTLQLLASNPTVSPTEIAAQIGRSRQTVYDYFAELEANGRIHRNGSE
jgi:hypothetical protein